MIIYVVKKAVKLLVGATAVAAIGVIAVGIACSILDNTKEDCPVEAKAE
jgi:hypothetical protein